MKPLIDALKQSLATGKAPRLPAGGDLLWEWFVDLSRARSYQMAGPNAISYSDMEAYARLNRLPLSHRHIAILRQMDDAYLEHAFTKRSTAPEGVKSLPPVFDQPMTGGMFDAMFG